jgi:hypothetical protein
MKSDDEIKDYKTYLRAQIARMEDPEYGNFNQSLLDTYKAKYEALCYLTKLDKDRNDKLAVCKWIVG